MGELRARSIHRGAPQGSLHVESTERGGVRVYAYGALAPVENAPLVETQMRGAHRYRNTLVEIERGRRAALRAIDAEVGLGEAHAAYEAADARVAELTRQAKALRAETRRRAIPGDLAAAIEEAKRAKIEARDARDAVQRALRERPDLASARDRVNETANELAKNARAHCGVYWGTYQLIEEAMRAARAAPFYDRERRPSDPDFVRWEDEGAVSVQVVDGADPEELYTGQHSSVRLERVALPHALGHSGQRPDPASRKSQTRERVRLWLRVGSDAGRAPVWAVFPVLLHRPLPEGSRVKRVSVYRRKIGPRAEWSAQFVLELPAPASPRCGLGAVAVNFGWRVVEGGLRCATWRGEGMDTAQTLVLGDRDVARLRRPETLESTRDTNALRAQAAFVALLARAGEDVPAWVREAGRWAARWKNPVPRLAQLVRRWAREAGLVVHHADYLAWAEPVPEAWTLRDLAVWRYHDHHLWEWETSARVGALRARREVYRRFAADLARRFGTLVIEDFDLTKVAEVGDDLGAKASPKRARSNRQLVAPSELREALVSAFVAAGGVVEKVDPLHATVTCAACGRVESFDAAAKIVHRCGGCGALWDQDANNVENLHARHRERLGTAATAGPARVSENSTEEGPRRVGRWAKARGKRAQREGAEGTARNVA